MKCTRTLSVALCLMIGAGLVAQGRKCGTQATAPKQVGKAKKPVKPKPGKPRDLAKKILKDFANGGILIHPAPKFGPGFIGGWQPAQPSVPKVPAMVDPAYQTAFQKLAAAQRELATATTPEKARQALDKIQKATMEVRRALWKAEKEGRKLRPRPVILSPFPILGGIRLHAQPPKVNQLLIPTVIH